MITTFALKEVSMRSNCLGNWTNRNRRTVNVLGKRVHSPERSSSRYRNGSVLANNEQASVVAPAAEPPTTEQLRRVLVNSAIPMIGFGIMDQTIMLQAGNAIDCTLGVTFGLSTLTAAALGQVCSNASGVIFGTTLESIATRAGLPKAGLTQAQRQLNSVKSVRFMGSLAGVLLGCTLGLLNLLWIDTDRSSTLKLHASNEEQEFEFQVEASNALRKNATTLTLRGPDVDGMLASMTAALAVKGCSLVEMHAAKRGASDDNHTPGEGEDSAVEDVFHVVKRDTGKPFDDEELEALAESLLDATRTPMNATSVKATIVELENTNAYLRERVKKLERILREKQITVVPSLHGEE